VKGGTSTIIKRDTDDGASQFVGGTNGDNGAYLNLYGINYSKDSANGSFTLAAHDGTNPTRLVGKPNGTLTWGGKPVESVVASSFGSSSSYIQYASGLIIQWGSVSAGDAGNIVTSVTFPKAFSNTNYRVMLTHVYAKDEVAEAWDAPGQGITRSTTAFKICYNFSSRSRIEWMAIGK
jgi:hypothetical protein